MVSQTWPLVPGRPSIRILGRNIKNAIKIVNRQIKIATWNTRSMFEAGSSTIKWGKLRTNHKTLYYFGNNHSDLRNRVGVILSDEIDKAIINFVPHLHRCILIQLACSPFDDNIIQIYTPTADKSNKN